MEQPKSTLQEPAASLEATRTLPETYQKAGTLDLSKDRRLMLALNILNLFALGLAGWLFLRALVWLRPDSLPGLPGQVVIGSLIDLVLFVGAILALTALNVILHEAIHGFFFWVFTRSRPHFAFRWLYAYAAAPQWYLPRNSFLVTTLAPLVLISLAGLVLLRFGPPGWVAPVWLVATMNAAGAVGDLAVAVWLLRQPAASLVNDRGDAITVYRPTSFDARRA